MSIESGDVTSVMPPERGNDSPIPELTRGVTVAMVAGYFGVWLAFFPQIILTVPLRVGQLAPDSKSSTLSIVLVVSAIFGLIAGPLAGRLSDRSRSRWGRRRPWILGSVAFGVVGLAIEAFAGNVAILLLGATFGAIAFGAGVALILALVPEIVPKHRRGVVSGYLGVGQSLATVVGIGLGAGLSSASIAAAFIVPGVLGLIMVMWLCRTLHEVQNATKRIATTWRDFLNTFWVSPRANPDFAWAWVSRFFIFMGFSGITSYQVYYLSDQIGVTSDEASTLVGISTALQVVFVVLGSVVSGKLSDRFGRRKIFVVGAACVGAVALLVLALATELPLFFVGTGLIGLAQGIYFAVDLALLTDILPEKRDDDGRDFGVFSLANQVPQSIAPAIAPIFLAIGFGSLSSTDDNYTALFVVAALFAVISAVAITRVRGSR